MEKSSRLNTFLTILRRKALLIFAGLICIGLGFMVRGLFISAEPAPVQQNQVAQKEEQIWTCSMHPQIQAPKPGQCPICGMDLIPLSQDTASAGGAERLFTTSEAAKALMNIQTSPVERRFVDKEVRMVGKVAYDETRLSTITAWVPGRLDRLYVDYTGIEVQKGDHLVYMYSPQLLTAQEELRQAAAARAKLSSGTSKTLENTLNAMLEAARNKLRRWGMTDNQIQQAERQGIVSDHITIYAPIGGTVIHRAGQEGAYVETGTAIYTIADLSKVWVVLEAYESDLPWLRFGQAVQFETESYPGERFEGKIAFIDPVLDPKTRTVRVRVNVDNKDGKLKPDMFVRARVSTQIAGAGKVMEADLAGKWISPMHPEVVKDAPGVCDVCGMDLVKAEDLGYTVLDKTNAHKPLIIPATAPLLTGKRAVVYVLLPDADKPSFEGREVVLGLRAGDYYIVNEGLKEGELVVTNGNFKIDSALQLAAKPSMMSPVESDAEAHEGQGSGTKKADKKLARHEVSEAFQNQLAPLYAAYFKLQEALAGDAFDETSKPVSDMASALDKVDMGLLQGQAHLDWMKHLSNLKSALERAQQADSMEALRKVFSPLSNALIDVASQFDVVFNQPIYHFNCSMAFDGAGADWLQNTDLLSNPYYGSMMLRCGTQVEVMGKGSVSSEGSSATSGQDGHDHGEGSGVKEASHE